VKPIAEPKQQVNDLLDMGGAKPAASANTDFFNLGTQPAAAAPVAAAAPAQSEPTSLFDMLNKTSATAASAQPAPQAPGFAFDFGSQQQPSQPLISTQAQPLISTSAPA